MLALFLTCLSVSLEVAILAALIYRRRLRRLLMLPVLLATIAISTLVPAIWPDWNTWDVWLVREATHAILALLLGLEIALRMGVRLPRARREARQWIIPILLALSVVVFVARRAPPMTGLLPLVNIGIAWLYVSLTLVARHHLIPVEPLHKTVLHGFTAYLLVYALAWTFSGDNTRVVNVLNPIAFNLLMLALLWAAWRDDTPRGVPESTLLHFWPWRRFEQPRNRPRRTPNTRGRQALTRAAPVGLH